MLEFQIFLEENDIRNKPNFDWSLELLWVDATMETCLMPLLVAFSTVFGPCDSFPTNQIKNL
jgi:hypothetical protein